MDLLLLEKQLKKRLEFPYSWGKKQSDEDDKKTAFIYSARTFSKLLESCQNLDEELRNYAFNRWLNFWSAKGVEQIFCKDEKVKPNYNQYDKLVDFRINEIPFDHKTSVFPKAYPKTLEEALENKEELILWFYKNQSQEGRKHFKNRIFLVLYNKENVNEHWKLKTEILYIKTIIEKYVSVYNSDNLVKLNLNGEEVWSDIIWIIK